jgi:hypothetical protein
LQVHLTLDNYATHTHPNLRAGWPTTLGFELHFAPTSSLWLNMVGNFLEAHGQGDPPRDLSQRPDLIDAIKAYLAAHNENPKPLKWTVRVIRPSRKPGAAASHSMPSRAKLRLDY